MMHLWNSCISSVSEHYTSLSFDFLGLFILGVHEVWMSQTLQSLGSRSTRATTHSCIRKYCIQASKKTEATTQFNTLTCTQVQFDTPWQNYMDELNPAERQTLPLKEPSCNGSPSDSSLEKPYPCLQPNQQSRHFSSFTLSIQPKIQLSRKNIRSIFKASGKKQCAYPHE